MPETVTVKGENILLDLLLWRRHGVRGQGLVVRALELNPGLAGLGPVLPIGTEVILPDLSPEDDRSPRRIVSLFG